MLRLVLRGFAQRKLRVALTAISIVLGVALMAGTYILTDTINNSFAAIFQTASKGHDVVVSPAEQLGSEVRSQTSPVTQQMVVRVRRTPGVAEASGSIFSQGTFLESDVNWDLVSQIVAAAPTSSGVADGTVSHIIVQHSAFDPGNPLVFSVYVEGANASTYFDASVTDGSVVATH